MIRLLSATIGAMTLFLALLATAPAMARTLNDEISEIQTIVSWPYTRPTLSPGVPAREWTWQLVLPEPNKPRKPLIIVLHGNSINANIAIQSTGFNLNEFYVRGMNASRVLPDNQCEIKNRLITSPPQKCRAFELDQDNAVVEADGKALLHYIEQVKRDPLVDPSRIYVFGESGGGFVLLRNLCKLAGKVAAVGVSGALPRVDDIKDWMSKDCAPGANIPYIHIHGTADKNVPYKGKDLSQSEIDRWGKYAHAAVETSVFWMAGRHKTNFKEVRELPNRSYEDGSVGTTVTSTTHYADGLPMVRLLKVNGGGHLMPGLFPNYPSVQAAAISEQVTQVGPANLDIVGADEIAKFFMLHKLD